ncbi:MAG: response regulator [Lachnospiraceae bacterium]|nr:response regulator [Lachnospiraceae bacterium]
MDNSISNEKVTVLCAKESFLAGSIRNKLEAEGVNTVFAHTDIKEMKNALDGVTVIIFFMSDETDQSPEALVYLKDIVEESACGLILIGDDQEYESVRKIVAEGLVTRWFKRPLDIEGLIKQVHTYLEENTGEKKKKTILIVDDDFTYMQTVFEWLKDDYRVGMASNGVQAISYLAKTRADLILLDYEMPIANGPQVLSMLKSDSGTGDIPVMFLTGHGDRNSVLSVVGLSPVDYLLKTIDKKTLLAKLKAFFKR